MKKYVWKIIYMMMLGVEVDFGHMEAVNLISSSKYSEKNVVRYDAIMYPGLVTISGNAVK